MADCSQYGESTPVFNPKQDLPDTWQPIGALVAEDVKRIRAAMGERK